MASNKSSKNSRRRQCEKYSCLNVERFKACYLKKENYRLPEIKSGEGELNEIFDRCRIALVKTFTDHSLELNSSVNLIIIVMSDYFMNSVRSHIDDDHKDECTNIIIGAIRYRLRNKKDMIADITIEHIMELFTPFIPNDIMSEEEVLVRMTEYLKLRKEGIPIWRN